MQQAAFVKPDLTEYTYADENFRAFRSFHRLESTCPTAEATLKGDYYFSRFSLNLIDIDSVEVTDRFAQILREDACGAPNEELPSMSFDTPKNFAQGKRALEEQLHKICMSENRLMREDLVRVLLAGGKRLRPLLALAAYGLGQEPKLPILPLMVMIELMHSASLIHDDVVDQGHLRRGVPTINATSGDYHAIQSADFLLGRAMELLKIYKGSGINERLAKVSEQMCIGELEQLSSLHQSVTEAAYLRMIEKKTAYLIEAAAYCGAVAGGCKAKEIAAMEEYGYYIGLAFQIKDDILDTVGSTKIGKTIGQDEKKGLTTLPAIIGLKEATERVADYSQKAVQAIEPIQDCASKKAFLQMAKQLENREI